MEMTRHFYGFQNSQALWPDDRHAPQQLLLHSLTKLGVHWVCAGRNRLAMCKAHLGHIREMHLLGKAETSRQALGKRKFKNINSIFPSKNVHIPFLC